MDIRNLKNHIFNFKLPKVIGLYQMLDPGTIKCRGRNIYHVVMSFVLLYMCLISMILMFSGLYYWTVNIPISMDYFWKSVTTFYIMYKTWIIIRHSNDTWNYLSITRYDFTSFTNRNRHTLDRWKQRLARLTTIYSMMYFSSVVSYLFFTLTFSENKTPVKNYDGSIGYYRQNAMNFYLIVSDETYNAHYYTFYFIEALFNGFILLSYLIFDILLVTICFGMCCQMDMICSAFESVGHKSALDSHSPIVYTDGNTNITPNERDLIWDELITIIMDHQVVMEKYKDFLSLFRQVMLPNIFTLSLSVIALCVTVIMKDSIMFSLYSSNWTEMDMKCKKLILLTMQLNNTNQNKLKFTRTKIVNLEMFFKTMSNCYSVISVLVNYIQKQDE